MAFQNFSKLVLPIVEKDMQEVISQANMEKDPSLYNTMVYHFGWNEPGSKPGKRIRPLLLLLTTQACGGKWQNAIPAATAIELLHNFSLIHDDIEDRSDFRRGREAVWKKYNLPLALNAGDSMYSLAYIAMLRLQNFNSKDTTVQALDIFSQTSINLTKGQHKDISFEEKDSISIEQYWQMINGKTAALISACTLLGAVIAGADSETQNKYKDFGLNLGLAFQVYDDLLGIWGDPEKTGKSIASDLLTRKKSLPVIYGLEQEGEFASLWRQEITPDNVEILANALQKEGAYDYTQEYANAYTQKAMELFQGTWAEDETAQALEELVDMLINRQH